MTNYTAAVKDQDGNTTVITSEYESKQAFKKDLNANGYTVIGRITFEGEQTKSRNLYEKGKR